MTTFLLKTEPSVFSYDDLARVRNTVWDGVTNNAALAHIRSARRGDEAFIYHTGDEKRIVGLARILSDPVEDPKNPGRNAKGEPKFAVFGLEAVRKAPSPVTLAQIRKDRRFAAFALVKQPRLSVMPVPPPLDAALRAMTGL